MAILSLNRRTDNRQDLDRVRDPYDNPWKAIEGTVRKVDEEKVKDCTEDIDTLLVFAGLYSAVLTAFLIESYKNLSADESESLLRQMVLQSANYRFTNGYLNSTFDPSSLPTFKAAVSDIRVNVCWFASLILSLSSASFGIAVKQWLREFLAMDYISPEERLRIRDARIHGLADWKLFQIAAFLPILLQVSLALFFVGLCFFTAAVHPSIGITSLFLVSCWVFFFFMSVMAPLFSPRCPYKTTILKVPFRYARPRVRAFLRLVYGRVVVLFARLRRVMSNESGRAENWRLDSDSEDFASSPSEDFASSSSGFLQPRIPVPTAASRPGWQRSRAAFADSGVPCDIRRSRHLQLPTSPATMPGNASITSGRTSLATMQWNPVFEMNTPTEYANTDSEDARDSSRWEYYDDYMDIGILNKLSGYVVKEDTVPEEEDTIRSADTKDLIIFSNIDSVFFDDSLLAYIPQALSQRLPLLDVLRFVATVIHHRSDSLLATAGSSTRRREWPWTLSPRVRLVLVDMLVESMEHELVQGSSNGRYYLSDDSEWSGSFVVLVSLVSLHDGIPSSVARLFEGLNEYQSKHDDESTPLEAFSYQMKTLARSDLEWLARSLLFLAQALNTLKPEDTELCLRDIVHTSFVDPTQWTGPDTYRRLLERTTDDDDSGVIAPTPQTIAALLEVARVILHKYIREQTHALDEFPAWISLLLEFVFDAVPRVQHLGHLDFRKPLTGASDAPGLLQLLIDLFATPHTTQALLHFFATHSRLLSSSPWSDQFFFLYWIDRLPYPTHDAAVAVLNTCAAFFESHSCFDSPAVLLPLCFLILYYHAHSDAGVDACWRRLFAAVPACYNRILNESDNKSLFSIGKLACNHSASDDPHTETCETAFNILYRCDFIGHHLNLPNETIAFLRKFMCGSHNGHKFRWLPRLDSTKNTQAEVTALEQSHNSSGDEQKTVSPDAKRSQLIGSDDTPVAPTPADDPDDQLDDGRHASARQDAVLSGLPTVDDRAPGDTATPLCAPIQDLTGSGSGGHDGGCAAEGLRCPDFAQTADAKPHDLAGTTAIKFSAPEARSMRLEENAASEPLGSAESVPVSILPGNTQGIDATPSPDILPTDPRANPAEMTGEHPPSPPPPAFPVPAPLSDDREAPGRDPPSASGKRGTAIPPDSRTMTSAGHDDASALSDAVERVDGVGDGARLSREGSGPLVALGSPGILSPSTAAPETRCSADVDEETEDDGGDLSVPNTT